jgi:two-component system, chemotaxis family, chemotaxis protein CheY
MSIPVAIVDDEELDRYITARVIKASGADCKIIEFAAGDEFADVVASDDAFEQRVGHVPPPLLVFLDINMPRMNGFEVLERLKAAFIARRREPSCFVVMMYSSSSHAEDRAAAMDYEFVRGYVIKPLNKEVFRKLVEEHYG